MLGGRGRGRPRRERGRAGEVSPGVSVRWLRLREPARRAHSRELCHVDESFYSVFLCLFSVYCYFKKYSVRVSMCFVCTPFPTDKRASPSVQVRFGLKSPSDYPKAVDFSRGARGPSARGGESLRGTQQGGGLPGPCGARRISVPPKLRCRRFLEALGAAGTRQAAGEPC